MDKNILLALLAVLGLVLVIVLIAPEETALPAEPAETETEAENVPELPVEDAADKQHELKIDGYVMVEGDSLPGVEVCLLDWHSGKRHYCTRSNQAGRFELMVPFDGEYKLLASHKRYHAKFLYIDTRNVPEDAIKFGVMALAAR